MSWWRFETARSRRNLAALFWFLCGANSMPIFMVLARGRDPDWITLCYPLATFGPALQFQRLAALAAEREILASLKAASPDLPWPEPTEPAPRRRRKPAPGAETPREKARRLKDPAWAYVPREEV